MEVNHEFMIHAICPFIKNRNVWDYYTVTVILDRVVDVHLIETAIDECRGASLSQEALCALVSSKLSAIGNCEIEMTGRHSANSVTRVVRKTASQIAIDSQLLFYAKKAVRLLHPVFPPILDDEEQFKADSRDVKNILTQVLCSLGETIPDE